MRGQGFPWSEMCCISLVTIIVLVPQTDCPPEYRIAPWTYKYIELQKPIWHLRDLTKWTQTIIQCYKNQLKMNEIVVKNICHLGRREEALFHISLWVCQPCLHIECDLATVAVEQTLKSCTWLIICNICKCHLIFKLLLSVCVSINKCPQFLLEIRYYSIPLQLIKRVTDQKWNWNWIA